MSTTIKLAGQDWCKTFWPNVKPEEFEVLTEKLVERITTDPKSFRDNPSKSLKAYVSMDCLTYQLNRKSYFTLPSARLPPSMYFIQRRTQFTKAYGTTDFRCVACKSGVVLVLGAAAAPTGPALAAWIVATLGISTTAASGIVAAAGGGHSQFVARVS